MQFHEVFDDGETEAEAAVFPRRGTVLLGEPLEDAWDELLLDAYAGIPHRNAGVVLIPSSVISTARPWRELDRIGQQIPDDLLETRGISPDLGYLRSIALEMLICLRSAEGDTDSTAADMTDARSRICRSSFTRPMRMRFMSSMSSTSWVRAPGIPVNHVHRADEGHRIIGAAAQDLRPAQDGGERCAQLVGEGG